MGGSRRTDVGGWNTRSAPPGSVKPGTSLETGDGLIDVSDRTDRLAAGLNQGFHVSGHIRKVTHSTRLLPHQILDGMMHVHNVGLPFTLSGSQPRIPCA